MTDKQLIKHPQIWEVVAISYIDDDDKLKEISQRVTIPQVTMKKLLSDKKYPFYEFMNEDGLSVILPYRAIIEIRRVIV